MRKRALSLLQTCMSAEDARTVRDELTAALRALAGDGDGLCLVLRELDAASESDELKRLSARAMRELMQAVPEPGAVALEPDDACKPRRQDVRRVRAARRATAALREHRTAPKAPTDQPVETLRGVGPNVGQLLRMRGVSTLGDLIWFLPIGYQDERVITAMGELRVGERQVTEGVVMSARSARGRMAEVVMEGARDAHGVVPSLRLVWFRAPQGLIARFSPGARYRVAGVVEEYRGRKQLTHPETQRLDAEEAAQPRGVVPRYPVVPGVAPRKLAQLAAAALERALGDVGEAVPAAMREELTLGTLADALRALHAPPCVFADGDMERWNEGRSEHHARLAFEEFFLLELSLFRRRVEDQGVFAEPLRAPASPLARVREAFGFSLTSAQERACREIGADLARERPMRRLLQGDVGSGKTAVAMVAAAQCVAAGAQVAFMAPTEVLAEQHFRSLAPLSAALGLRASLVLGGERASHRKKTRKALAEGRIDLAVGTHALLAEGVEFSRLRLVIVDEQHRFGVGQRLRLVDKSRDAVAPHLLVMTATPIPRTLALALHGDLATSVLDELPAGRIPITTRAYPSAERERALVQLQRALEAGGRAYVVCPAIEDAEETFVRSAEKTHAELAQRFAQHGVELLHGRLPDEAKDRAMERFVAGDVRVLVATTIVEVGLDVAQANVILIDHAERFGLAQLHQLRGRVGRAGQRSACLLVHDATSEEARARIAILCETTDGFRIAEEDLRLRGPGELFGRRQSGLPGFRFGDLRRDVALLERAREAAQRVMDADPELAQPEHAGARRVLSRFQDSVRAVVKEEAG